MKKVASLACAVAVLAAPHVAAQEPAQYSAGTLERVFAEKAAPAPLASPVAEAAALPVPAPVAAPASGQARAGAGSRSLLHTVGGAVVGAWLGFFTSQLVRSDWDKDSNAEVVAHRASFALGGAVFGGAGGMLIGNLRSEPLAARLRTAQATNGNEVISREQVDASGVGTAYELVQMHHPEWMRTRGNNSFSEGGKIWVESGDRDAVTVIPGSDAMVVYFDNARMGGPESLRQIPTFNVGSVEFLTAAQATYKWGINHSHGVIWVHSRER